MIENISNYEQKSVHFTSAYFARGENTHRFGKGNRSIEKFKRTKDKDMCDES